MRVTSGRGLLALAIVAALMLGTGSTASAATLFADPAGAASGSCKLPDPPCTLQRAVEVVAVNGDEVVVNPGAYSEGANALTVDAAINLHGAAGSERPTITSTANDAVAVSVAGVLVHDLRIEHSGAGVALDIQEASTAERVIATSSANVGCLPAFGAVIRDSVCHSSASGGAGVRFIYSGAFGPTAPSSTSTLINVTAVASVGNSSAIDLGTQDVGQQTLNATNVIASGNGSGADVAAFNLGTSMTINLDHSNYDTESEPGTATVTDPGSGTNQLAPPQFVDAASGGFHQAPASPTIDAGAGHALLGSLDIDGEARSQGAAPDIGADEFTVAAGNPPPNGDNFPPETGIRKGPKKRTPKRKARFEFGGSEPGVRFECQLDDGGWKPCSSPEKLKGLKRGKHVFAVRSIDVAGNPDPTPADRKWKVTKRRKRD